MSAPKTHIPQRGSEKNFGIVFAVVFLIVALWPLYYGGEIRFWAIALSVTFLALGFWIPGFLKPLNIAWFYFGLALGKIVAPIVLTIIFVLVVVPTGVIARLLGKDPLQLKRSNQPTYWVDRTDHDKTVDMTNQF